MALRGRPRWDVHVNIFASKSMSSTSTTHDDNYASASVNYVVANDHMSAPTGGDASPGPIPGTLGPRAALHKKLAEFVANAIRADAAFMASPRPSRRTRSRSIDPMEGLARPWVRRGTSELNLRVPAGLVDSTLVAEPLRVSAGGRFMRCNPSFCHTIQVQGPYGLGSWSMRVRGHRLHGVGFRRTG